MTSAVAVLTGFTDDFFLGPFVGAIQAAVSVLITLSYGVAAGQFHILDNKSAQHVSALCAKICLPALLVVNVGYELRQHNIVRYVPVMIWALIYNLTSILFSSAMQRLFKLPQWTVAVASFNNTTSMPLLLVKTLHATGILQVLIVNKADTTRDLVNRATSFFLFNSLCGSILSAALGPLFLDGKKEKENQDEETHRPRTTNPEAAIRGESEEGEENPNEVTSLLAGPMVYEGGVIGETAYRRTREQWNQLHPRVRLLFNFILTFVNAPMIGGLVGVIVGLTPPLHRALFAPPQEGGVLNAWFTTSAQNVGDLFATLQALIVGVKLSDCLGRISQGRRSGSVPWRALAVILILQYVLWPVVAISVIYSIALRTNLLSDEPILWFSLMLMPIGPSAMNLASLTEENGSSDHERLSLSKCMIISYALSPVIAFAVVGSLRASQHAIRID